MVTLLVSLHVRADEPASAPAPDEPTEAVAVKAVKAYHAMLVAGDFERAVKQYFDFDQILSDVFEEAYRDLGSNDRRRLRELFYPAMEPVMAHPAMREAMKHTRFGDYSSRSRASGRVVVEFVTLMPSGERRNGWMTLHHFDGRWRILDVGAAGSGGFVGALRNMWRKAREQQPQQTPVGFFEKLASDAQRIMKRSTTQPQPR